MDYRSIIELINVYFLPYIHPYIHPFYASNAPDYMNEVFSYAESNRSPTSYLVVK